MSVIVKKILQKLGFDRAVSFGVLARLWSLFSGPITMLTVASGFTPDQQGFYYTFGSLLAMQAFFDLGLMFVISQFASHEFVHLSWESKGRVKGDPAALSRFSDLVHKTVLWFGIASLLMLIILIPSGLLFFGNKGAVSFSWRLPWILAVVGTALNLFVMPFFAIIMGSGDVVTANKRDLAGTVLSSCLCWLTIWFHKGLYAAFAVNLGVSAISWGYLLMKRPALVKLAWQSPSRSGSELDSHAGLSWWGEIWPMQWRMAISSGAAYFMFQLFTPVLFHYQGPVVAGQMGMTMTAANVLMALGLTLINAKNPQFAKHIALAEWKRLDVLFMKVLRQATLMVAFAGAAGTVLIWLLQRYWATIGKRFIPAELAVIFFAAVCVQVFIAAFAIYLRSHKADPLVWITLLMALLQGLATWYLGKYYSIKGEVFGYLIISTLVLSPAVVFIWYRFRRVWHT